MVELDRRAVLAVAGAATAAVSATSAEAQPTSRAATPLPFTPMPLGFDPSKVPGISERLIRSHYENNYVGAVRRLGTIRADIAKLDPGAASGFLLNGLKREELLAWNSMILHEVHFEGFGERGAPAPALAAAIERDFGSHDRWAAEFAATGKALGGGSGWVLLTWSPRDRRLVNQWASDHTQTLAGGDPLLALDMYEHAYHMDYGSRAAAYVEAFMKAFSWRGANARFAKAAAT
jgi:superoxide dismutase, Fe-Mn family